MTLILAGTGLLLVVSTWVAYLSTIPRAKVPTNPSLYTLAQLVGVVLVGAALALAVGSETLSPGARIAVYVVMGMSMMLFSTWLFLMATRKTPAGALQVDVGDSVLPFVASRSDGTPFDLASLQGERYLLKFFRGSWCPYCAAELKRFEELSPLLQKRRVRFIALSKDEPETAARQVERDGLSFPLLSDPELKVIRQYGVEHHKAIEFSKAAFTVFGMPLALVPSVKTMAIPTTILVDEDGIVRWIDQSDDYRLRSSEARVLRAIDEVFGVTAQSAP